MARQASMCDPRVSHALDKFIGNGRGGLARIVTKLDVVCLQSGDAVATYEDVDHTTSDACPGKRPERTGQRPADLPTCRPQHDPNDRHPLGDIEDLGMNVRSRLDAIVRQGDDGIWLVAAAEPFAGALTSLRPDLDKLVDSPTRAALTRSAGIAARTGVSP